VAAVVELSPVQVHMNLDCYEPGLFTVFIVVIAVFNIQCYNKDLSLN